MARCSRFLGLLWLSSWMLGLAMQPSFADTPGGPLRVKNTSPVSVLYGIPRPFGGDVLHSGTELAFSVDTSSNFTSDRNGNDFVFFDGETSVISYNLRRAWRDGWEWGVEVPWVVHTGGELDTVVDAFHETFGLDDGGRPLASRDQLDYLIRLNGETFVDFDGDTRLRLGDVRGFVGRQLLSSADRSTTLRAQVKLPTGSFDKLSGSEAVDVSAWVEHTERSLQERYRLTITAMAGVTYLGEGELAPSDQESLVAVGHFGLRYGLTRKVELIAQVDAHSRIIDSGIAQALDGAVQGTLGGRVHFSPKLWLDLGLVEDLKSRSSPDVVFMLLLGARI